MPPSSRYPTIILGTAVICAGIWFVLYGKLVPPGPEADWVWAMYEAKTEAAHAIDRPMLLLIGGSGAHFGIDTNMLEDQVGLPSINFGGHGGLGIDYYLYRARAVVAPGDTVLLAIEYELFDQLDHPTNLLREIVYFFDPEYVLRRPLWQWPQYYFALDPIALLSRLIAAVRSGEQLIFGRFRLSAESLDERGNETVNRAKLVDPFLQGVVQAGPPIRVFDEADEEVMESLSAFVDWCRRNGIEVIATWPNVMRRPAYDDARYRNFFARIEDLYAELDVPMVGRPQDAMLRAEDMFDTVYHPNDRGRAKRTARLAESLCALKACPWRSAGASPAP